MATEGTFSREDELARLPVPTLEESCHRFLDWCRPLLHPEEYAETQRAVDDFLAPDSAAWILQKALAEYDVRPEVHSWLDEFWRDRYLGRRDRIALNANFVFILADRESDQIARATSIVSRAVAHHLDVAAETFPPTVRRDRPVSMEQHKYLFSTHRIPGLERDGVRTPFSASYPGPSRSRHIVVMYRGQVYRVEVLDGEGRPHTPGALESMLRDLRRAGTARGQAVGELTTMARPAWAGTRRRLRDLAPENAAALETIETALFALCLEDLEPDTVGEACRQVLAGDSGNRWFDHGLSFVVFGNGRAGVNVEHSMIDGTTVIELIDVLLAPEPEERGGSAATEPGPAPWSPISFVLDDDLRETIVEAGEAFAEQAAATATRLVSFPGLGSAHAKALGISPDAFAQLSFQLAHRRAVGFLGATYESVSTRAHHHGRTEAMRVVTPEIVEFVAAMDDPSTGAGDRTRAIRRAADAHTARAKDCAAGRAPEQHLWELELIQRRRGEDLGATGPLALYRSPGWRVLRHDFLSTSAVPSVTMQAFGFGATSEDCIGVAYWLLPDAMGLFLATPTIVADRMDAFAHHLEAAMAEIGELLASPASSV